MDRCSITLGDDTLKLMASRMLHAGFGERFNFDRSARGFMAQGLFSPPVASGVVSWTLPITVCTIMPIARELLGAIRE